MKVSVKKIETVESVTLVMSEREAKALQKTIGATNARERKDRYFLSQEESDMISVIYKDLENAQGHKDTWSN